MITEREHAWTSRLWSLAILSILAFALLAGCTPQPGTPQSGPLETPVLIRVEEPQGTAWATARVDGPPANITPKASVMPTRVLRMVFTGPLYPYVPSLRSLDGQTVIALPKGRLAAGPDGGYFEDVSVDVNTAPATHTMFVQLPAGPTDPANPDTALPDPLNFNLAVVAKSLSTNRTDSAPLVVEMVRRPIFTVTVRVDGDGRVNSTPAGISCGTTASGAPLRDCSFDFGAATTVQLFPGSGSNGRFRAWGGDCNPTTQVCTLALSGLPARVIADFGAGATPIAGNACGTIPLVPGWRFVDVPGCGTALNPAFATRQCDAQGHFCCRPQTGGNAPRCGGAGQAESRPTCQGVGPNALLIQPGGCYERSPP